MLKSEPENSSYNIYVQGRDAYAHVKYNKPLIQDSDPGVQFLYQPPAMPEKKVEYLIDGPWNEPLPEIGYKFASSPRILNDAWVVNLGGPGATRVDVKPLWPKEPDISHYGQYCKVMPAPVQQQFNEKLLSVPTPNLIQETYEIKDTIQSKPNTLRFRRYNPLPQMPAPIITGAEPHRGDNYDVGTMWLDTRNGNTYVLTSKTNKVCTWQNISGVESAEVVIHEWANRTPEIKGLNNQLLGKEEKDSDGILGFIGSYLEENNAITRGERYPYKYMNVDKHLLKGRWQYQVEDAQKQFYDDMMKKHFTEKLNPPLVQIEPGVYETDTLYARDRR